MCFNAGAETVQRVEGNMSGAVMRGPVALPGSETRSRTKGSRRNLGDLISPTAARAAAGHDGKSRRRSRRGRGEESDDWLVPVKPRTTPGDGSVRGERGNPVPYRDHLGSVLRNPPVAVGATIRNRRRSEQLGDDGAADLRQRRLRRGPVAAPLFFPDTQPSGAR